MQKARRLCPRCRNCKELSHATCHLQGADLLSSPTFKGLRVLSLLTSEFINTAELYMQKWISLHFLLRVFYHNV